MADTSPTPHTPSLNTPLSDDQLPRGFSFAAVRAGLKASGNPDLACAVADQPATAAAMFTSNKVIAALFGCDAHSVFPSSTGIIGVPLAVDKLTAALPALHAALGSTAAHLQQMAGAIMTTDTRPKIAVASFAVNG